MAPQVGADQLLFSRHSQSWAAGSDRWGSGGTCQAGEHQPQAVQQLGASAEGAANARHAGPLVQRQRRRDVKHLIHAGLGGLGHPPPGVGGQGVQVAARALGIQHTQCQ